MKLPTLLLFLIICAEAYASPRATYSRVLEEAFGQLLHRITRQADGVANIPKGRNSSRVIRPSTDLIRKWGYPAEGHYTKTDDGYILRVDRIPRPGAPAVLICNPLSTGSSAYLLLEKNSFAFKLYDAGWDVWLGNMRGGGLSLNHERMSASQREFWDFSLHEHGALDVPAMVDYILSVTLEPSLSYAGISMGSTTAFITAATRPEYDELINGMFLMAPVTDLSRHGPSILLSTLHALENTTARFAPDQFPAVDVGRQFMGSACLQNSRGRTTWNCPALRAVADMMGGFGGCTYNVDMPDYAPSSMGLMEVNHYAQLANPDWPGFRRYNYGRKKNRDIYGQDVPPDYDVTKTRIPIYMYVGENDVWTPPQTIKKLSASLKNCKKVFEVKNEGSPGFAHMDFAINAARAPEVYDVVIQDMNELRTEQSVEGNKIRSLN